MLRDQPAEDDIDWSCVVEQSTAGEFEFSRIDHDRIHAGRFESVSEDAEFA
ncbi:hypothetical protein LCGC14_2297340, partial [marine sediment metagenome]